MVQADLFLRCKLTFTFIKDRDIPSIFSSNPGFSLVKFILVPRWSVPALLVSINMRSADRSQML